MRGFAHISGHLHREDATRAIDTGGRETSSCVRQGVRQAGDGADLMSADPSIDALDFTRLEEIGRLAALADRGDTLTVVVHCKQIAAVTREAFATVSTLGETDAAT
jgi:hypothetical protein